MTFSPLDNFSSKFYAISNILRIVFTILNRTKERETTVHELVEKVWNLIRHTVLIFYSVSKLPNFLLTNL